MLQAVLTAEVFTVFMVFARVGSAFVMLPTIGEQFLTPRARLALAVLIALVVAPTVDPVIPDLPPSLSGMLGLLFIEILVGLFIGTAARLLFMALAIAGSFYSFMSGLASALMFNPLAADQGALLSILFSLIGILLLFATDSHHLLIRAVVESYVLFEPGVYPMVGDMADVVARTVTESFRLGLQLAAPIVLVSLLFYVLLGLLARLMPQMQVFFIAMPLQIMMGLYLLMITLSATMMWFLSEYHAFLGQFLPI
ncbi:MAG: flagellar biosynthetic protein FliR [Alphaproteobacteria bacterium]|jgi:flagellar biosynthetic protein FliR|uniref:flagellar biosynthetic protein FliR n=1 Tax=Pacificispira sp. TaxID=2888761 RepID=UPI001B0C5964|nr:flagellar biosynthetic protein FliR [Alphaproteobacteria bacterium]MBO6861850.1 flagellar biosynthetic protein FliR [Alphaproteobacteria bacterium]MEC9266564.1 flagellar biosynthetic protein FliR [Pseudomonadota bacterium]